MARRITHRELLQQIDKLHPAIAKAFAAAFTNVRSQAQVTRIAKLIAAGRLDMVADELGLDSPRFSDLTEEIRKVYAAGGKEGVMELAGMPSQRGPRGAIRLPGSKIQISFDLRNQRAETWLRNQSSRMVTELVADQRNAIRIAVSEGTLLGNGPRQTALDIVGRIGPNGRRSGGIVGLTSQQTQFVANARSQLLSGNAADMRDYLGRARRDKRFDSIVNKAIKEGKAVAGADVDRIMGRYSDRLLQLRGENIARAEALAAFNEAREEAFRQAVDTGLVKPHNVRKTWSATMDGRTRDSHADLNGVEVGLDEAFDSPTGARMMHPGDTSLGAGAEDVINCRCMPEYRIDMIAETMR